MVFDVWLDCPKKARQVRGAAHAWGVRTNSHSSMDPRREDLEQLRLKESDESAYKFMFGTLVPIASALSTQGVILEEMRPLEVDESAHKHGD